MALLSFLPEVYQGVIIMMAGIVLFLHTIGFLTQGLQYLLIGGSVYMMALGFVKMGGIQMLERFFQKK